MGKFQSILGTFQLGFPILVAHTITTLALMCLLSTVYLKFTRQNFLRLIKYNNVAASIAFGSVYISFAIPLGFCLSGSVDIIDIIVWAFPLGVLQILCFLFFDRIFYNLKEKIEHDEIAIAIFVASVRLAIACVISGAITS